MDVDAPYLSVGQIEALARRIDRPLVLVGMMGVGKSTVGRKLAALLRFSFVDADEEIEGAAKMTIPEMFETYGETYFRDGERRVIARLIHDAANAGGRVIATGGGAFVDPETRALILDEAIAIWLDCDVDTLVERVGRKGNRPLLRQGDPREILTRLRDERAPTYSAAPIRVESMHGPHQQTAIRILQALDAAL
ncbi:shikimate kinase [Novosphingobium tardum]|uniref:Shikimate kinase n=1 Tax=Novosphingobium tardum TaxID=1538021 RepID=A0ABV8RR14_9SPHN